MISLLSTTPYVISSFTTLATNIFTQLSKLNSASSHIDEVQTLLQELDLTHRIEIIESFLNEIGSTPLTSVQNAIKSVVDVAQQLESLLESINAKVSTHQHLWVPWLWSLNLHDDLLSLKRLDSRLQKRMNLLFQMLNVFSDDLQQ
ncbi:MAG: hypothetical protein CMD97_00070 [Gammaproteobacteria bacterium]|nr:hypothetical protein [Gammaproteobacteria bacterium]|tara:strand:+ start:61 stop:498 length:438 start_codon:yes stop_codon:yes gene_type:complete